MPRPGTRLFIGPLTPAQRRRRDRARETFREVEEMAYARNISMKEAFHAVKIERENFWARGFRMPGGAGEYA